VGINCKCEGTGGGGGRGLKVAETGVEGCELKFRPSALVYCSGIGGTGGNDDCEP